MFEEFVNKHIRAEQTALISHLLLKAEDDYTDGVNPFDYDDVTNVRAAATRYSYKGKLYVEDDLSIALAEAEDKMEAAEEVGAELTASIWADAIAAIQMSLADPSHAVDIKSWFAVSPEFAEALRKRNEVVLENSYGIWWGSNRDRLDGDLVRRLMEVFNNEVDKTAS